MPLAHRRLGPAAERESPGVALVVAVPIGVAGAFFVATLTLLAAMAGWGSEVAVLRALATGCVAGPVTAVVAWRWLRPRP
jgi:hypothetical protein